MGDWCSKWSQQCQHLPQNWCSRWTQQHQHFRHTTSGTHLDAKEYAEPLDSHFNCHSVNMLTKYDVGPQCGSLKTAKGCRKLGSLTKSATCSLCNSFPSVDCCPFWQVPVCYK